ncbi:hypothetical protein AYI70_g10405 [Smittium culicis]|uniref:Endoplasmic reticulum membrane protein n=1 Tax=Smittium culicis TaxID=133412 RepID=A0A1R1X6Q4_9FUNG|nr:hypothetical protein AYI70_g10405 [Smittium culicis]
MFFDFKKHLVEHGVSHVEEGNVIVHIICTPFIIWAMCGLLTLLGPIVETPEWLAPFLEFFPGFRFDLTWGSVFILAFILFSIIFDPIYAALIFPLYMFCLGSTHMLITLHSGAFSIFIQTIILGFSLNLLSHYLFEKRMPRIFETKSIATFFFGYFYVTYAFLLYIGYCPVYYEELKEEIRERVAEIEKESKNDAVPEEKSQKKKSSPKKKI